VTNGERLVVAAWVVFLVALFTFAVLAAGEERRACEGRGGKLVCHYQYVGNNVGWSECNCLDRSLFR
jgi:hypothetical protein